MAKTAPTAFHIDPQTLGGSLVFKGTRVPVRTLISYLKAGFGLERFLYNFPTVTREQVFQGLEEAHKLLTQKVLDNS